MNSIIGICYQTPRLQVNLIYGIDTENENRPLDPQWSLFGHQSEDWEVASLVINLKKDRPFQIEIRVKDVTDSQGDVHFDDLRFTDCGEFKRIVFKSTLGGDRESIFVLWLCARLNTVLLLPNIDWSYDSMTYFHASIEFRGLKLRCE